MLHLCRNDGFCGGSGGYVPDLVDRMERLDAVTFASLVLIAEGWPLDQIPHETEWRPRFEQIFRDVFGDGDVELGDDWRR